MYIVSVNVGRRRRLDGRSFQGDTGIFKESVAGAVQIGELGLDSDVIVDTHHHGGADQAVYLYRQEDYDWWSTQLGRPLGPGVFGENLTLAGLPSPALAIGTRLEFSTVVLEVSAPRIPCNTLASRMADTGIVKQFMAAERPGAYCRVVVPGRVEPGEAFALREPTAPGMTTIDLFRGVQRKLSAAEIQQFLAQPIDARTRDKFEDKLRQLEA